MERIGEVRVNTFGSKMTIIDYKDSHNITVQFESGYVTNAYYYDFKRGTIKDVYAKSSYSIGYIGEGIYKIKEKGKKYTQYYKAWYSMLGRCYNKKYQQIRPTYIGCTVCEEWHNFQNFGRWYDENYYEIPGEKMHLDKDILVKGNKVYSPETCVFVPQRINSLFVTTSSIRGIYPIGVHIHTQSKQYISSCTVINKIVHLGCYPFLEEAFQAYKEFKENYIKEVADEYKDKIPLRLYEAMYKYEVEITD